MAISRDKALLAGLAALALAAVFMLAGCGAGSGSGGGSQGAGSQGAAAEDAPGPMRVLADDVLEHAQADRLAMAAEEFDKAEVEYSFAPDGGIEDALRAAEEQGNPYDLVIVSNDRLDALVNEAGLVGKNTDNGGERNITEVMLFNGMGLVLARAAGSDADLPPTERLDGSGERLPGLAQSKWKLAVCSPDTWEGRLSNNAMSFMGLYDDNAGDYAEEVRDKIVVYDGPAAAAKALVDGECGLALLYDCDIVDHSGNQVSEGVEQVRPVTYAKNAASDGQPVTGPSFMFGVVKAGAHKNAARKFSVFVAEKW